MHLRALVLFCCVAAIRAQFGGQFQHQRQSQFNSFNGGGFNGGGFNSGFGNGGFDNGGLNNGGFGGGFGGGLAMQNTVLQQTQLQKQSQAQGNSAAAGNAAGQGEGSASSINQAQHQANDGNTAATSLSANTASGTLGSSAGGAAQAGGQVASQKELQNMLGQQGGFQRFKRQYDLYGSGFGSPQSLANANSLGGGSALFGQVATNNNAFSQSNPYGGMGFAAGNALGEGQGVNIYQAANSNSQSGIFRRKRDLFGNYNGGFGRYSGFGSPQSNANANALGGGSALFGQVATNNNAFSRSDPFGATGFAAGNSNGQGQGVNIYDAANTNSASGVFG